MRINLIGLDDKIVGHLNSDNNPKIMTTGLVILLASPNTRYFAYNSALHDPAFLERSPMVVSPAEIEHDSNNHASTESA